MEWYQIWHVDANSTWEFNLLYVGYAQIDIYLVRFKKLTNFPHLLTIFVKSPLF